jgi:hypothetical protein
MTVLRGNIKNLTKKGKKRGRKRKNRQALFGPKKRKSFKKT